jgi:alkylhydroperoxidase family enzyme
MQRLKSVNPEAAEGQTKELLGTVQQAFGVIPNTTKVMANSPAVLKNGGKVSGQQLDAVREAGFSDGEIVEVVASVVLGCFTNFLNNVADTELDIPQAEPVQACAANACSV